MTYAADRFQFQDPSGFLPNNLPIVVLYGVQLVAALICFVCVDRQGRRSLLLISTATAAIALLALGLYLLFEDIGKIQFDKLKKCIYNKRNIYQRLGIGYALDTDELRHFI